MGRGKIAIVLEKTTKVTNMFLSVVINFFPKGEFLYELTVWVPFFVAIFKLFIDQLLIPPTTCGFIVVGGGGGGRIFSC